MSYNKGEKTQKGTDANSSASVPFILLIAQLGFFVICRGAGAVMEKTIRLPKT